MAEGQVYAQVDASVVNGGIAPMAMVSGNPEPMGGQEAFGVWIRWNYNTENGEGGFTGTGWYVDDPNNPIKEQYGSEEAFKKHLVENQPSDLDHVLGDWGSDKKAAFFNANQAALGGGGCYQFVG